MTDESSGDNKTGHPEKDLLRQQVDLSASLSHAWASHVDRTSFLRAIERWLDTSSQDKSYVLVAGINRMFMFNESFGLTVADEIIEKTGAALRDILGQFATVFRIDGNSFGLLLNDEGHHDMVSVARYVLGYFHDVPLRTAAGSVTVSLSLGGVALERTADSHPTVILAKAEAAMRAAKERRFSGFVSYEGMADQTKLYRKILTRGNDFLQALKENRVKLAYQPVVRAGSKNTLFHECLIRMLDEEGNVCLAGDFVPAIEQLGLSHLADKFALQTALQELVQYPDLGLSINVSHMSLHSPEWMAALESVLRNHPNVAQRLVVELTESAAMGDRDDTIKVIARLQELGCRVALDDFGAGYTAFSQIKDMNIDFLKIDKSYIRNIQDDRNRLFVQTLQMLADGLGVETIGEGAETQGDANLLLADGVTNIQGYAFGLPLIERVWLPKGHEQRRVLQADEGEE